MRTSVICSAVAAVAALACGAPPANAPSPKAPTAEADGSAAGSATQADPGAPVEAAATPAPAAPAEPVIPPDVASAPAWVFRYNAATRQETWTLRYHGGTALLLVETAQGKTTYVGPYTESNDSISLNALAPNAKMSLDCKHDQLAVGAKCNDRKAKKQDVLNCFHPDYEAAMPFGADPGLEYVANETCTGYRLLP